MLDQELSNRIRQVFEDYEDPTSPAQGWKSLRKKYPSPVRRPLLLWWATAAAVLLIALGGSWLYNLRPTETAVISKPAASGALVGQQNHGSAAPPAAPAVRLSKPLVNSLIKQRASRAIIEHSDERLVDSQLADLSLQEMDLAGAVPGPIQEIARDEQHSPESDRSSAEDIPRPKTASAPLVLSTTDRPERRQASSAEGALIEYKRDKDELLSIYAGSFFNYAEGSEMKLNFGAGLSSDVRISAKLRLTAGISMAQNSLSFKDNLMPAASEELRYASPSLGYGPSVSTTKVITNYDASLLSLDIPISLKYMIIPEDNRLYISAGLVSGTYLTETYALNYRNYSTSSGLLIDQSKVEEKKNQLQTFDLARTLNLSFGFNAPISKHQTISVEPFIRYPLGGLGSENLRFGASGINIRLNLSSLKN